jgi:hypothetical protein
MRESRPRLAPAGRRRRPPTGRNFSIAAPAPLTRGSGDGVLTLTSVATSARPELVSAGRQATSRRIPSSLTTADTPTVARTTLLQNGFGLVEACAWRVLARRSRRQKTTHQTSRCACRTTGRSCGTSAAMTSWPIPTVSCSSQVVRISSQPTGAWGVRRAHRHHAPAAAGRDSGCR